MDIILYKIILTKSFELSYYSYWRLGFCGKSVRENASWTESAFEMSSKLGNTPVYIIILYLLKEDTICINAGGTAGLF